LFRVKESIKEILEIVEVWDEHFMGVEEEVVGVVEMSGGVRIACWILNVRKQNFSVVKAHEKLVLKL